MRYKQYKNIIELCESLNEAFVYIYNSQNVSIVSDCIMVLSAIAEILENSTEKEVEKPIKTITEIVSLFEDVQGNIERLVLLSERLAEECRVELKYKLRILFVAELSSKWDSMKSVYESFVRRDDCEVDVVLEPIFRATKLPDGSTKSEIIYDDWLTPMGIKHILFKGYDIGKVMPDITFISQPYESVTIPQFWPQNIAKYSKLVYLPYYTAADLENGAAFESFFKMPIERYAWRIVCQSEEMKACYKKYASQKGENVIVTGLPKWDYPMSLDKKNTPCPKEWVSKIEGKKVFLLNTHFTMTFKLPEDDINSVFNLFTRKDIAVVWRPHPMTEVVSKLYSPDNYKIFQTLKKRAEESDNIVFDVTDSYAYGFVWSDALITGKSSIMQQYMFVGKPIACFLKIKSNEKTIFDFSKIFQAYDKERMDSFLNDICNNSENCSENTSFLLRKYFYLADGNVGKRVCECVFDAFLSET